MCNRKLRKLAMELAADLPADPMNDASIVQAQSFNSYITAVLDVLSLRTNSNLTPLAARGSLRKRNYAQLARGRHYRTCTTAAEMKAWKQKAPKRYLILVAQDDHHYSYIYIYMCPYVHIYSRYICHI